ncbi:hypothetical protein [Pseudomonas sp. 28 E 9]|nr:hypothetical protein [Pseudomonas sp. 28 E 9]
MVSLACVMRCLRNLFQTEPRELRQASNRRLNLLGFLDTSNGCSLPKAVAAFVIAEGFVLRLESTKVIKKQIAESLYVAYDDAASYLAIESKG